jgi:hypothetical protein
MNEAPLRPGRYSVSGPRIATAVAIVILCVAYLWFAPAESPREMIDHHLYRLTTEAIRNGEGYYAAMEGAFEVVYGTERGGLIENVRAFRMPTTFYLFSVFPNDQWVWYLYVMTAGVAGIAASYVVSRPVLGALVTAYLLALGMLNDAQGWVAQFMATELWAVAPLLGAVALALRRRWWPAALLALAAMLVRETAGLLLIVAAGLAVAGRLPRKPWLTAFGLGGVAYLLHAWQAMDYIDSDVGISVLEEVSSVAVVAEIMGFGLPVGLVIGPALWLLAAWHVRVAHEHWILTGAPLLLAFAGVLIDRVYWGILVAPFALLWGIERILGLLAERRGRSGAYVAT